MKRKTNIANRERPRSSVAVMVAVFRIGCWSQAAEEVADGELSFETKVEL